jgi:hypothetical protein
MSPALSRSKKVGAGAGTLDVAVKHQLFGLFDFFLEFFGLGFTEFIMGIFL